MNAPSGDSGLTFAWPEREKFPFVLFGCVFLSLIAHAMTFLVFQVVYPQRVTIPPPPPQVSLLAPTSPENEALLRWIAAEDPALVASARSVVPANLLSVPYQPSFSVVRAAPLGSIEEPAVVPFPPARNPLSVIASAAPRPQPEIGTTLPMRTTLDLSVALAERGLKPPSFHWKVRASEPLQPLRALIGVSDRGEVRFTFLQNSSGDAHIDAEALDQLAKLAFAPGDAAITWAVATVDFGAEAYTAAPAELRSRGAK
ncbi:MAG TPA: hypothetical protein VEO95_00685 [Chthoniobacteraceae bacterium]|nr:hypothetical protein [Chthoniobacteraceae bacterium]